MKQQEQSLICPKCGCEADSITETPNAKMWMYNHRLPEEEWMIPGVPQANGCIAPKTMKQ